MYFLQNLKNYLTEDQIEKIEEKIFEAVDKYDVDDEYYNNLTILFNSRLRTTAGQYTYYRFNTDSRISLNPKYLERFGFDHVLKTFAHELAHFVTTSLHLNLGHSEDFKKICVYLGGHMNSDHAGISYKNSVSNEYITSDYKWHYKCPCGQNDFKTKRRLGQRKRAGNCRICKTSTLIMERKL